MPEPFYKPSRDTWYVELHRKQHSLGRHPQGTPKPKRNKQGRWKAPPEIQAAFHRFMTAPPAPPTLPVRTGGIAEVIDKFLGRQPGDHRNGWKPEGNRPVGG